MVWILLFLILLLAGIAIFLIRSSQATVGSTHISAQFAQSLAKSPNAPSTTSRRTWGKKLVADESGACQEALDLNGMCFSAGSIPHLPLPGCTQAGCTCKLEPMQDNRSGDERRAGIERREDARFEDRPDRRRGKDRRKDNDHYQWHSVT